MPFHEAAHLGDLGRWLGHGAAATTDVLAGGRGAAVCDERLNGNGIPPPCALPKESGPEPRHSAAARTQFCHTAHSYCSFPQTVTKRCTIRKYYEGKGRDASGLNGYSVKSTSVLPAHSVHERERMANNGIAAWSNGVATLNGQIYLMIPNYM